MTYEQFKTDIVTNLKEKEPSIDSITLDSTLKNNGVLLDGITIKTEGSNIAPTIYLDGYYKEFEAGTDYDQILKMILLEYKKSKREDNIDISFFFDYENRVKDRIIYKNNP